MLDGTITDLRYKVGLAELKIRTGNKESRYSVAMNIQQYRRLSKRQGCRYKTNGDQLAKLEVDGEDILAQGSDFPKGEDNRKAQRPKSDKQKSDTGSRERAIQGKGATAPYNFVPVNDRVVRVPVLDNEIETAEYRDENGDKRCYDSIPSFKRYHKGLHHGFINLDIEVLTPLYIRAAYTLEQEKRAREADEKGGKWENPEFFSPGGMPRIPGSSLRGMTRSLIEIVSCSRMEYVDDSTLYFRSLADKCRSIRNEYFNTMGQRGHDKANPAYRFSAGYLQRTGHEYQICPARTFDGKQYKRTPKLKTTEFSWHWQKDGSCITVSGADPAGKKTKDWLIHPVDNNAQAIRITAMDMDAYRNDSNR